jgi:putative SOS response-associated peptidase YedK
MVEETFKPREVGVMCGRFAQKSSAKKIAKQFKVEEVPPLVERYNVASTQSVLAVREPGEREAVFLKWGLVPRWAKDAAIGNRLINARAETVTEKPSFREAFAGRRCLVPLDGFYEWARRGDSKRPFYFYMRDEEPFAVAGLWEVWEGDGGPLETCTLLTTEANELLAPYHDRMPVILRPEDYELWLNTEVRRAEVLQPLLRPYPREEMTAYAVSPVVNSPSNDSRRCIESLADGSPAGAGK